jgi:hypothetical protein
MNLNDLKTKLANQRTWREPKTPGQSVKRWKPGLLSLFAIVIAMSTLIVLAIVYAAYVLAPKDSFSAVPVSSTQKATVVPTHTPINTIMFVCAGLPTANLHVRFTPNGSVRGYLREGEQVKLVLDADGKLIIKERKGENWIRLASPIEGWANTKYLCK